MKAWSKSRSYAEGTWVSYLGYFWSGINHAALRKFLRVRVRTRQMLVAFLDLYPLEGYLGLVGGGMHCLCPRLQLSNISLRAGPSLEGERHSRAVR